MIKRTDIKLRFADEIKEKDLKPFINAFKWKYDKKNVQAVAFYTKGLLGTYGIVFKDTGISTMFGKYKESIAYENIIDVKSYMDAGVLGIKILDKEKRVRIPGITSKDFDVDNMISLLKQLAEI